MTIQQHDAVAMTDEELEGVAGGQRNYGAVKPEEPGWVHSRKALTEYLRSQWGSTPEENKKNTPDS